MKLGGVCPCAIATATWPYAHRHFEAVLATRSDRQPTKRERHTGAEHPMARCSKFSLLVRSTGPRTLFRGPCTHRVGVPRARVCHATPRLAKATRRTSRRHARALNSAEWTTTRNSSGDAERVTALRSSSCFAGTVTMWCAWFTACSGRVPTWKTWCKRCSCRSTEVWLRSRALLGFRLGSIASRSTSCSCTAAPRAVDRSSRSKPRRHRWSTASRCPTSSSRATHA